MKKLFIMIGISILFLGCSSKEKVSPSYQMQKQDAQKAWKELGN